MPQHRRTQKGEWRWSFDVKSATKEEWFNFTMDATQHLDAFNEKDRFLYRSPLTFDQKLLNHNWQGFKDSLIQAAHGSLPKKKISPYIYRDKSVSDDLKHLQTQTFLLNRVYYTVFQFLYDLHNSKSKARKLQSLWTSCGNSSRRPCLLEINSQYDNIIDPLSILFLLNRCTRDQLKILLDDINSLRKLSNAKRSLLEEQHKEEMIKAYANARCTNFATNKAAFIASSLSKTRQSIVLDRVMHTDVMGNTSLVTDPKKIKDIANLHYQTIAGSPPTHTLLSIA